MNKINDPYASTFQEPQPLASDNNLGILVQKYWLLTVTVFLGITFLAFPVFFGEKYKKLVGFFINIESHPESIYSFNLLGLLLVVLAFSVLFILSYYNIRIVNIDIDSKNRRIEPFEIHIITTETIIKNNSATDNQIISASSTTTPQPTSNSTNSSNVNNSNSEAKTTVTKHRIDFKYIERTIRDLDESIAKYNVIGLISLDITVITLLIFGGFVFNLFEGTVSSLERYRDYQPWGLAAIIFLLRTSLLGTFIISFMINAIKFTNSSFDQAVRFNKRKHASLFLMQVISYPEVHKNELDKIMTAFKEWNVNIESAFSDGNFTSKMAEATFNKLSKIDDMYQKAFDVIKSGSSKEEKGKETVKRGEVEE